jgi:hypothetical protein
MFSRDPKEFWAMALNMERREAAQNERARALDDDRVLSFRQWCELNGFSKDTGLRLRKSGRGPIFTQLSDRRIGVTVGNNRAWLASRSRGQA